MAIKMHVSKGRKGCLLSSSQSQDNSNGIHDRLSLGQRSVLDFEFASADSLVFWFTPGWSIIPAGIDVSIIICRML